jgi:hypothetical protein
MWWSLHLRTLMCDFLNFQEKYANYVLNLIQIETPNFTKSTHKISNSNPNQKFSKFIDISFRSTDLFTKMRSLFISIFALLLIIEIQESSTK